MKFYIPFFDFQISLPPIPQFDNKSWNFIFPFLIFKSHYRQYHSLKIKVEILYSHFGFSNLTFYFFHGSHYPRNWDILYLQGRGGCRAGMYPVKWPFESSDMQNDLHSAHNRLSFICHNTFAINTFAINTFAIITFAIIHLP